MMATNHLKQLLLAETIPSIFSFLPTSLYPYLFRLSGKPIWVAYFPLPRQILFYMTRISLINIGHELLNGRITNTNASKLGAMLQEAGYLLSRTVVIPDDPDTIQNTIEREWADHDVVLISGGLGPTKDDMTKHVLAKWWGTDLEEHQPTVEFLYKRYQERGREMNPNTRSQAMAPIGSDVLHNPVGTAPGLAFAKDGKWLAAMPGVPYELFTMVEGHVLPHLKRTYPRNIYLKSVLRMHNVSESEIAIQLEEIEEGFPPSISMAYLPRMDGLWLEIKTETTAEELIDNSAIHEKIVASIRSKLTGLIYTDTDKPLPELIGEAMVARSATLSVAESLTGGGLASQIVSISGSSRYFQGSVTAYSPEAKINLLEVSPELIAQKTVVSAEVAIAMAEGVKEKFGTDYAISTTGWAEAPDEDTRPGAWLGYAGPEGVSAIWINHYYRRTVNIERTIGQALGMLLQKVTMNDG